MRKTLISVAALTLVAGLLSGPVGARENKVERRVEGKYLTPALAAHPIHPPPPAVTVCQHGGAIDEGRGCVVFPVRASERFIQIEVHDTSGLPVQAFVAQGEEMQDEWDPFCGKTDEPVRVTSVDIRVVIYPYTPTGLPLCPGTATRGSVEAVLSNVP